MSNVVNSYILLTINSPIALIDAATWSGNLSSCATLNRMLTKEDVDRLSSAARTAHCSRNIFASLMFWNGGSRPASVGGPVAGVSGATILCLLGLVWLLPRGSGIVS